MKKEFKGLIRCERDENFHAYCVYIDAPEEIGQPRERAPGLKIESPWDWIKEHFLHRENEGKRIKITVQLD